MSSKGIVISDPEGFSIKEIYEDHIKKASGDLGLLANDTSGSTKLYICGDILDSTKTNLDDSKLNLKSHNLRNIKLILDNPNIILLFGNRDLNKIKTKFLCELDKTTTTTTTTDIDNFNKGMIGLDYSTYDKLKKDLIQKSANSSANIWTAKMKNWYPFWNPNAKRHLNEGNRAWSTEPVYTNDPFLARFNVIFGPDTRVGTMSAQNLLHTIFLELCEMFTKFDKSKTNDDYKAYLVLAIFRSMVLKADSYNTNIDKNINTEQITSELFKGWLYKLYTDEKNNVAECLESCCNTDHCGIISLCETCTNCHKNIVLLSHGGIPEQLIESFKAEAKPNKLDELKIWLNDKTDGKLTDPSKEKYGGFINNSSNKNIYNNQKSEFKTYITMMNKIFKDSVKNVLKIDQMPKPDKDMLFLLITAAETNIQTDDFTFNSKLYSPIVSGFEEMRKNHFFIEQTTLYQVFGHKPVGYAATVDLFNHNDGKATSTSTAKANITYHITLDTSNTFVGTSTHNITEKDMSFNCFYINDKLFKVYSKINATFPDKLKPFDTPFANINKEKKDSKEDPIPSIIYSHSADLLMGTTSDKSNLKFLNIHNLIIDYDLNSYTDVFKLMIDQKLIDNQINFHGVIKDASSNIKYFIFTYNVPNSFVNTFYYLNLNDFKQMTFGSSPIDPIGQIGQIGQIAGYSNNHDILYLTNKISELKYKLNKYKLKYAESKKN
jgi:hypothetical protein